MYYDLTTEADKKQFLTKVQYFVDKGKQVELIEKKGKRTLSQNNYLHMIISFFCIEYGCNLEFAKQEYFKKLCNPDIFLYEKEDQFVGKVILIRSSSEIDTTQMTIAIERFRNWSSSEAGIYLPDANEERMVEEIQKIVNRQKRWL